jgi:hypothetical protein
VITSFLKDAAAGGTVGTTDPGSEVPDGVTVESPFMYMDGDVELEGYLAYPTDAVAEGRTVPVVVVLPDWTGLDEVRQLTSPLRDNHIRIQIPLKRNAKQILSSSCPYVLFILH